MPPRRKNEPGGHLPQGLIPRRYRTKSEAFRQRELLAERLRPLLERVIEERDHLASLKTDPVSFVHEYESVADQEIVAMVASTLAYGNVKAVRASIRRVLTVLGPSPASRVHELGADLVEEMESFVHRFTRGRDMAALLHACAVLQAEHGGLGRFFARCWEGSGGDLRRAVFAFVSGLRGVDRRPLLGNEEMPPGLSYLLPDGSGPGACKRLHMFLRWMVRGPDGIDLGLWTSPSPADLLMPLDTHTSRLSQYLCLTTRKDASWTTTEEVTWHLAGIDVRDPVRFDFALAHLGISKACTHDGGSEACLGCALASGCRLNLSSSKRVEVRTAKVTGA